MPERPAAKLANKASTLWPNGAIVPRPVTATRCTIQATGSALAVEADGVAEAGTISAST